MLLPLYREESTMATSEPIRIQIDPEALRSQIRDVIREEMQAASLRLRFAADALDPEFMPKFEADMTTYLRKQWEAEQEGAQ